MRYLERSRVIIIKKPFSAAGESERHRLTDEELGPSGVIAFKTAADAIRKADFGGLPVSPIDWIKARIRAAGYSVGEITGRSMILDYTVGGEGGARLAMRPGAERTIAGRRKAIGDYNGGRMDAIILNQAGSTGLSLHASEKVKDQRPRVMLIAQAEGNIDTHMQMLGRVNRTGQVVLPRYAQLVPDVPATKRPASVLAKKMASLNANTTADRSGALTAKDTPDFMNLYGDIVAASVMGDNPDIHLALGSPLKLSNKGYEREDAMRRITGRIPLLPVDEQERVYDMLETEYAALLAQMDAAGENVLEAKTLPLDARTIETREFKPPAEGETSPFADGVYFETVDAKALGKPMKPAEVLEAVAKASGVELQAAGTDVQKLNSLARAAGGAHERMVSGTLADFRTFRQTILADVEDEAKRREQDTQFNGLSDRWMNIARMAAPGSGVVVKTDMLGNLYGVVVSVKRTGRAKNPLAMGSWKVQIALADPMRTMTVPFSRLYTARDTGADVADGIELGRAERANDKPLIDAFNDLQGDRREERVIVTGNLLAGYEQARGRGSIINFTDQNGRLRQGILMPRQFDLERFTNAQAVPLRTPGHVMQFVSRTGEALASSDMLAAVRVLKNGNVQVTTDASRDRGGTYYLNAGVLSAAGRDFVRVSGEMRIEVDRARAERVVAALMNAGATFAAGDNQVLAREITGTAPPSAAQAAPRGQRVASPAEEPVDELVDSNAFTETTAFDGGRYEVTRSEESAGRAAELQRALRIELDRMGLSDIGLRVADRLRVAFDNGQEGEMLGAYMRSTIDLSLNRNSDTTTIEQTLHHEALHALARLAVFTESEWSILSRKSEREWIDRFGIRQTYTQETEEAIVEEGIAHAYHSWVAGARMDGIVQRSFRRMRDFLEALGNAVRGLGFTSANDLFRSIESGRIGARRRDTMSGAKKIDPRFQRNRAATPEMRAVERESAMQGFIARGQPLDRALRVPFNFLGGVDANGEWTIGKRASEIAGNAIVNAKFGPESPFAWMNGVLHVARSGLIDRYGLAPDYVARDRQRALDARRVMMQGQEILTTLKEQEIGAAEARVLQAVLTGEEVADADMTRLSVPIRQAIDQLGQEAVTLGLVSPESYERNRGTYLHRVYQKYEVEQNGLAKLVGRIMGRQRKKIIGDQLKGRGMFFEVDMQKLVGRDPEWKSGARGRPQTGERFRILDRIQPDMQGGRDRTTDRVYWPADRLVPADYAAYKDQGVWEIRGESGQTFTLWRDYTKAERASMGEIMDARYTIAKTFMLMSHDLANGRFFKDIAENEEWSTGMQPAEGTWVDPTAIGRYAGYGDTVQWVRVPDATIPKSGGKKRYGALAGRYVRAEIWRDLNEVDIMSQPTMWRTVMMQWKLNKTARSPVTHMNNVMSNVMFMDLADVRGQDLVKGIRSYARGDRDYEEARDNGAFGADMIAQEMRDTVLKPLLEDIAKEGQGGASNPLLSRIKLVGNLADRIWTFGKAVDQKMLDAYRIEDEVFRMATYMRRRSLGDTPGQAADFARQQFLDYDIRAPWVNAARNTVLPFISYVYRAAPLIAKAVASRPWKLAKYFAVAYALNALAYWWDDEGDEEKERYSLREEEQGWTWFGVPRMVRMPWRSEDGMPVFLDIRRWIPAGDIFDMGQGSTALPIPAPLMFGGPAMIGAELWLNKQSFTGEAITNDLTDTGVEAAGKVGDYLWKSWMPSAAWVPGSWYWQKIANAATGATDATGRDYDLPSAVSSSVGIKLKPQDVEQALMWQGYDLRKVEQELRAQARALGRQRERNLISEAEYNSGVQTIMDKMGRVQERAERLQEISNR